VAFVPGAPFYANNPDLSTLRLSFATAPVEKIEDGVIRLGQAL
jgi:2-aminoadipate transaminase